MILNDFELFCNIHYFLTPRNYLCGKNLNENQLKWTLDTRLITYNYF